MFYHVDAKFDADRGIGRLSCTATGDPAPVLYWIQPSGRATKYSPDVSSSTSTQPAVIMSHSYDSVDEDRPGVSEAVLELDASTEYFHRADSTSGQQPPQPGMYICVADNEAGNATVTVSLPRPSSRSTSGLRGSKSAAIDDQLTDITSPSLQQQQVSKLTEFYISNVTAVE